MCALLGQLTFRCALLEVECLSDTGPQDRTLCPGVPEGGVDATAILLA